MIIPAIVMPRNTSSDSSRSEVEFDFTKAVYYSPVMARDPFLEAAIEEARQGLREGGIPIGSVLVKEGQIIGRGHNRRVQNGDPITHAEIDCLRNAGRIGRYAGT